MRKALSVAIVIGVALVALQSNFGARAQPWPSHLVVGLVTAPPDATFSNAVAWLTTQATGPLVIQNQLSPPAAPGDSPSYGIDVGNFNYDWTTADTVLVAFEVVRGVNGYSGVNWTGSQSAVLTTDNVQPLPDTTLQQFPVVTTQKSIRTIWANFSNLATTTNIVSYGVWRSPTPNLPGSWVKQGSVPQAAGALSFSQSGLADGTYCYRVNVEYKRNALGTTVNGTTAASEWTNTCQTIRTIPSMISVSPRSAQVGVLQAAPVAIVFNKAINTGTFAYQVTSPDGGTIPTFAAPSWNATRDMVTLNHPGSPYDTCLRYTVQVTAAQDDFGQNLAPNPAIPNPWTFTIECPNPQIRFTTPVDGAVGVKRDAAIVINFTKPMDQTPADWSVVIHPFVGLTPVWTGPAELQLTPQALLTLCTPYTVFVAANDTGNAPLTGVKSWSFTANCAPLVTVTAPTLNTCYPKGSTAIVTWTATDTHNTVVETPDSYLQDVITYNSSAGWGSIGTGTGATSYNWLIPTGIEGTDFHANVNVTDNATDTTNASSPAFTIDQTAPTIAGAFPSGIAVPYTTTILVNFSENMAPSTSDAITFNPAPSGTPTKTWADAMHLQITATLAPLTWYNVTINTSAKDSCGAGNNLAADYTFPFHTLGKAPKAPTLNTPQDSDIKDTSVVLTWTAVTQYVDDTAITGTVTYQVYRNGVAVGSPTTSLTYTDSGLTASTTYNYIVRAFVAQTPSANSNPVSVTTKASVTSTDWTWLIIIIIVIIIVVVLLAVLLARRKKPEAAVVEEAPPAEEAPVEEAPAEEAPAEEAPPAETPPEETPPEGEAPPEGGEGGGETPPPA